MKACGVVLVVAMAAPASAGRNVASTAKPPVAPAPVATTLPAPSAVLAKPAFTATPSELRAEVARILTLDARYREAAVTLISDESRLSFDAQGRVDSKHRMVFIVNTQVGADDWGTVSSSYAPFYQDKPTMRIRVIARDNSVTELDPKLIVDRPDVEESANIFSDSRKLDAPLPRLVPGAIVEEEFVYHDREPMLAAGTTRAFGIGRDMPVYQEIVSLSAPTSLRLKVTPRGFAKAPVPQVRPAGMRSESTYVFAPSFTQPDYQYNAPTDVNQYPTLHVSTALTWAAVAADYRKLVEPKISAPGLVIPSTIKGATDIATVNNLVAWLHARVRYTGIEFGDAAFVPWTPAETLARGFGDCKDTAALLVAGLRSVGIKADLAVLNTGPGVDIERAAPGMGRFDHAIVRAIVGGKPLWIDGTEDMLPAGVLPVRDQGRLAMVVSPDAKDLELTPVSGVADTVVHEVREFVAAEEGGAALVETTTESGIMFDNMRRYALNTKREDIDKGLITYVKDTYHGTFTHFRAEQAADVAAPFAFVVETSNAKRVFTSRDQIDAYLFAANTLWQLPQALRSSDAEYDDAAKARTLDFVLPMQYRHTIENRIVVPTAFELPTVNARNEIPLGAFRLVVTRTVVSNVVTVTYAFETTKARLSPDEFRATRKAIRELFDADGEHLIMRELSSKLSADGKHREAIAEGERQVALHPTQAASYDRLAEAYRKAGLGRVALRTAQKATTVDPKNGDAFAMLGWMMRHDWLGRDAVQSADRAGAIAAYERALALSPTHVGAHADLATVLAADASGATNSNVAELRRAIDHLKLANEIDADDGRATQLAALTLWVGDYDRAETLARGLKDSSSAIAFRLEVVAFRDGAQAALSLLDSLNLGSKRDSTLQSVIADAMLKRRYDLVHELALGAGASTPAASKRIWAKIKRVEGKDLDLRKPEILPLLAMLNYLGAAVAPLPIHAKMIQEKDDKTTKLKVFERPAAFSSFTPPVLLDLFSTIVDSHSDGDATNGWRVTVNANGQTSWIYAILENGKATLLGEAVSPAGVGLYAYEQLGKKNTAAAQRFLGWLTADLASQNVSGTSEILAVWKEEQGRAAGAPMSASFLTLIAAAFAVDLDDAKLRLSKVFERCEAPGAAAKALCKRLREAALLNEKAWPELEAFERSELAANPANRDALERLGRVLFAQNKSREALQLAEQVLANTPANIEALRMRADALVGTGASEADRTRAYDAVVNHPDGTAQDLNQAMWARLFVDKDLTGVRALAERAEAKVSKPAHNLANTLAAVAAESDDPNKAWRYFNQSRAEHPYAELNAADWYVLGRIYEGFRQRDEAIAAYRKVERDPFLTGVAQSYDFAQRGLARLKAAAK